MADNLAKYVTQHGLLYLSTLYPSLPLNRNRSDVFIDLKHFMIELLWTYNAQRAYAMAK